jgi:hypothetical protein
MSERLIQLLDELDTARTAFGGRLEELGRVVAEIRASLDRGAPVSSLTRAANLWGFHEVLTRSLGDLHHLVAATRAEAVRIMVEDEGMTLAQVAGEMGRPRQLVGRLYREAKATP